jgi:hypothetical protein
MSTTSVSKHLNEMIKVAESTEGRPQKALEKLKEVTEQLKSDLEDDTDLSEALPRNEGREISLDPLREIIARKVGMYIEADDFPKRKNFPKESVDALEQCYHNFTNELLAWWSRFAQAFEHVWTADTEAIKNMSPARRRFEAILSFKKNFAAVERFLCEKQEYLDDYRGVETWWILQQWSPEYIEWVQYNHSDKDERKASLVLAWREARAAETVVNGLIEVVALMRENAGDKMKKYTW